MPKDLHTFIEQVRRNLDHTAAELDRLAAEALGKPVETFTDADYDALKENSAVMALYAQYEREEAHLWMLEQEAAREAVDAAGLLAQSELDEDIEGGD